MDCGLIWVIIFFDFIINDFIRQWQFESGGLIIDDIWVENFIIILVIVFSLVDEEVIWVGIDDGYLQFICDGGKSWIELSSCLFGVCFGSWIFYIEVL